jgi:NAD(P)-dependent dehydrogenase (short-subunit alcohol dehydrogenase family)
VTSIQQLFDLSGKRAIVTGGGAGLGYQMAYGLAEAGAQTVLCGRKEDRVRAAAETIERELGVKSIAVRCDVRDEGEIHAVVEAAKAELGGIDILVNNSGTSWGAPAVDYPLDGWRKVVDVNLTGLFLFTQAVGRHMIETGGGGKIINLSSVMAFQGAPSELLDAVGYAASKGGVISLTRDLAVKWAAHGINVNAIAPGWFPTDMSRVLLERSAEAYLTRIPLNRFGGDDDLKGAAVYLASRASDYVTGQTLVVDGGQTVS